MAKLPSFQFYPGDWRKDPGVQALNYEERGVWFEMILLMFESSERGKLLLNGKKMPEEALSRSLGLDNQKSNQIVSKLIEYGVAKVEDGTGIIFCSRMLKDEFIRKIRTEAGKKGGNPALLNQNTTTAVNQITTPSSSSSSSPSTSKNKTQTLCASDLKILKSNFEEDWISYPKRNGSNKKNSFGSYKKTVGLDPVKRSEFQVKTRMMIETFNGDLKYCKNADTWFRNWEGIEILGNLKPTPTKEIEKVCPPAGVDPGQTEKWVKCMGDIEPQISPSNFTTLFETMAFGGVVDGKASLICGNQFHADSLAENYTDLVETTMTQIFDKPVKPEFKIKPGKEQGRTGENDQSA